MTLFQIDPSQFNDIEEHPYYKALKKKLNQTAKKSSSVSNKHSSANTQTNSKSSPQQSDTPVDASLLDIEDQVKLSASQWEDLFLSDSADDSDDEQEIKHFRHKEDVANQDNRRLIQFLGYQINFKQRIPELKELFRYNMIQSKSHNYFLAKFSQFKTGVVGQILSWLGVPVLTLRKMKRQALQEAFDENIENMTENIYHTELAQLIYGNTKKSRSALQVYRKTQTQLIQQMENLGHYDYWSTEKLLETRYQQLAKIRDEFIKEKLDLEYDYSYQLQAGAY